MDKRIRTMRKTIVFVLASAMVLCAACNGKKPNNTMVGASVEECGADTTAYGVCGDGTAMHTLQLITDLGDTLEYALIKADDSESSVAGGLMAGDRVAVTGHDTADGRVADKVINLTSLLGRWTSIDKNFVIEEGGTVSSSVKAETESWANWKIFNGHLLLNKDTFDVVMIGADSLSLENNKGIFVYKRRQ